MQADVIYDQAKKTCVQLSDSVLGNLPRYPFPDKFSNWNTYTIGWLSIPLNMTHDSIL